MSVLLCWDTLAGVLAGGVAAWLLPYDLPLGVAKEIYTTAISVLSILFSVYFASLAIIVSAPDDDFVVFLDDRGDFVELIFSFRWTLGAILVSLLLAVALYAATLARSLAGAETEPLLGIVIHAGLFIYALCATMNSAGDCTAYALRRRTFVRKQRGLDDPAQ